MGQTSGEDGFDIVHARTLHLFPELVATLGGDASVLMNHADIAPGGRLRATYSQMSQLLELAAQHLKCPDFGMRLGRLQGGGFFGPLGTVMRNSRTFGEALDYVCTHTYAHSLAARITRNRRQEDDRIFMSHDILLDGIGSRTQLMEQILLVGHLTAMEMTGGHARVWQVHFRHQPLSPLQIYRRNFGCDVRFGQAQDGVVYTTNSLESPIIDPDVDAYRAVTAFIDTRFTRHMPPVHAQVRGLIMRFLGTDLSTNERIADELNLHPRTLHRRLKAEGCAFQKIKDDVRRDLMLYYLQQTTMDFAHISERLGFAEQSVFTRSCNRWLDASPTAIRSRARHAAAPAPTPMATRIPA